jgi:hypothetical protein
VRYAEAIDQVLPIGSGVVGMTNARVSTNQLSGIRCGRGAQAILRTRGWDQSDRFDDAWALVAATYKLAVHALGHVVPLKRSS